MDPLTTLSVACNVLQLVECAVESITACKAIYDEGSLDKNRQVEEYADRLSTANKDLCGALQCFPSTRRRSKVADVATDVSKTADELKIELNKLKLSRSQGSKRLGGAFAKTLRTLMSSDKIKRLRQKLQGHESALQAIIIRELHVNVGLHEVARKEDSAKTSQELDKALKKILDGQQSQNAAVTAKLYATEVNLLSRVDKHESRRVQQQDSAEAYLQAAEIAARKSILLNSLSFPELNDRRNMIESRVDNFGGTYAWLFKPPRATGPDLYPFTVWLKSREQRLYAVLGKPGSGKSSALDYIYHQLQSDGPGRSALRQWAEPRNAVVLSFWFYRPAFSALLRSLQGFWRTLCFQILDNDPTLAESTRVNQDGTAPPSLASALSPTGSHVRSWTDKELKSWFEYLLRHSEMCYCLLVDGLDELEDHRELLLATVLELSQKYENLKVCCSSRPESPFNSVLRKETCIQLHELNYADIAMDCHSRLRDSRAAPLAEQIARRAAGVFLWASLVTEDLCRAARFGESEKELECRLDRCPDGISQTFLFMLKRHNILDCSSPKPYLRVVALASRLHETYKQTDLTLLQLFGATLPTQRRPVWRDLDEPFEDELLKALDERLRGFAVEIEESCACLVQILPPGPGQQHLGPVPSVAHSSVTFIHRSVQDFLREDAEASAWLARTPLSDDEVLANLAEGALYSTFSSRKTNRNVAEIYMDETQRIGLYLARMRPGIRSSLVRDTIDCYWRQILRCCPHIDYSAFICCSKSLSDFDHLAMGFASFSGFTDLVESYLIEWLHEGETCTELAEFALCTYFRRPWYAYNKHQFNLLHLGEFVRVVGSYIDPWHPSSLLYTSTAELTSSNRSAWWRTGRPFSCTRVLDHMVMAFLDKPWFPIASEVLEFSQLLSKEMSLFSRNVGGQFADFAYGWIVCIGSQVNVIPAPDAYPPELGRDHEIFAFRVKLTEFERELGAWFTFEFFGHKRASASDFDGLYCKYEAEGFWDINAVKQLRLAVLKAKASAPAPKQWFFQDLVCSSPIDVTQDSSGHDLLLRDLEEQDHMAMGTRFYYLQFDILSKSAGFGFRRLEYGSFPPPPSGSRRAIEQNADADQMLSSADPYLETLNPRWERGLSKRHRTVHELIPYRNQKVLIIKTMLRAYSNPGNCSSDPSKARLVLYHHSETVVMRVLRLAEREKMYILLYSDLPSRHKRSATPLRWIQDTYQLTSLQEGLVH